MQAEALALQPAASALFNYQKNVLQAAVLKTGEKLRFILLKQVSFSTRVFSTIKTM